SVLCQGHGAFAPLRRHQVGQKTVAPGSHLRENTRQSQRLPAGADRKRHIFLGPIAEQRPVHRAQPGENRRDEGLALPSSKTLRRLSGLEVGELKTQARDRTYDMSPETLFLLQTGRSPARPLRVAPVIKTGLPAKFCAKARRIVLPPPRIAEQDLEQVPTNPGVKTA